MALIDAARYPSAAAYLAGLPAGLDSYPECQISGVYVRLIQTRHPGMWAEDGLPAVLRRVLSSPVAESAWLPLVMSITQNLVTRDRAYRDDAAYLADAYDVAALMFKRPLFKLFAQVLSPNVLLMGASRHFATVHKAVVLRGRGSGKTSYELEMEHPPSILTALIERGYGAAFQCAVTVTGAQNVSLSVTPTSATRTSFSLAWAGKT